MVSRSRPLEGQKSTAAKDDESEAPGDIGSPARAAATDGPEEDCRISSHPVAIRRQNGGQIQPGGGGSTWSRAEHVQCRVVTGMDEAFVAMA